jgi:acetoin utilization deacetylase AcuC-like enzyme
VRIWLIGADQRGAEAIKQLRKNANLDLYISDSTDRPYAVTAGVIAKVDLVELVTSLNINTLARRIRPDLILIDVGADQHNLGRLAGGGAFTSALHEETATASDYPCLVL